MPVSSADMAGMTENFSSRKSEPERKEDRTFRVICAILVLLLIIYANVADKPEQRLSQEHLRDCQAVGVTSWDQCWDIVNQTDRPDPGYYGRDGQGIN